MKKLMFGLAIAAVGTAFAVESSNIVGYSTTNAPGNDCYIQFTPKFVSVSDSTKFMLSGIAFDGLANYDTLQVFDADGELDVQLTYRTNKKIAGVTTVGWYDDNGDFVSDKEFSRGQSFWMCTADEVGITDSGAVAKGNITIDFPGGDLFTQTGNCLPVPVALSSINFTGLSNYDTMQFFDQDGELSSQLTYRTNKKIAGVTTVGWYDDDGEFVNAETFVLQPGAAFWICTAEEGSMTLPAVVD